MNFLKKAVIRILLPCLVILMPVIVFAQQKDMDGELCSKSGRICNPIGDVSVTDFIQKILQGALKLGIPIVALAIIYSGFLFVFAQGKPEGITKAKDTLMYTLIGAAVLLGSYALAQLISETVKGVAS